MDNHGRADFGVLIQASFHVRRFNVAHAQVVADIMHAPLLDNASRKDTSGAAVERQCDDTRRLVGRQDGCSR